MSGRSPMDPFSDFWNFLTGASGDYKALGAWKYLFVTLFLVLLILSILVAVQNWREDPPQKTGRGLWMWVVPGLVGGMWFSGNRWETASPRSQGYEVCGRRLADPAAH